jgi:phosphatidylethanolamine/phosphatidyl-N-methylethanolamine N-methyltransferase
MHTPTLDFGQAINVYGTKCYSLWKFFYQWLRHPLSTAAIAPSSSELAMAMLAGLPEKTRRVIELGAGTGVFTQALLDHGITKENLLVLEMNRELHDYLQRKFPGLPVLQADASHLLQYADSSGYLDGGEIDAIVSGLGLLSMDLPTQHAILSAAFECLKMQGVFVQFTYGLWAPVKQPLVEELGLNIQRGEFVFCNLPPATVYIYSRLNPQEPV